MAKLSLSTQQTGLSLPARESHSDNLWRSVLKYLGLGLLLFVISEQAQAADLHQVLKNLRSIIGPITFFVLAACYLAGIFFLVRSVILFRKIGAATTQMHQPGDIGGPLLYFVIGAVLMYIPSTTDLFMNSIFGATESIFRSNKVDYKAMGQGAEVLSYISGGGGLGAQWADIANTVFLFIQLFGFIFFVKGWFLLAKIQGGGAQQGNLGKGFTHIIGGIILINFVGVVHIIGNTLLSGT